MKERGEISLISPLVLVLAETFKQMLLPDPFEYQSCSHSAVLVATVN